MTDSIRQTQHRERFKERAANKTGNTDTELTAAQQQANVPSVPPSQMAFEQQSPLDRLLADPSSAEKLGQPAGNGRGDGLGSEVGECHIQARFNPLGPGYYHGYILTSDDSGTDFFRGGPGRQAEDRPNIGKSGTLISGTGGMISQSAGTDDYASSNSGNALSAGSGPGGEGENLGLFGSIVVDSGVYNSDAQDWQTEDVPAVSVARLAANCDSIEAVLQQAAQDITHSFTPYNPLSANSNSVARELLARAGFSGVESPVWAPGWRTEIKSD